MNVIPINANASGTTEEATDSEAHARSTRTRARDATTNATGHEPGSPPVTAVAEPVAGSGWPGRAAALWRPPELWSEPRPSLSQVYTYAWAGSWTGENTPSRWAGRAYALVISIPAHTLGYGLLWLVERPTRIASALLLSLLIVSSFLF